MFLTGFCLFTNKLKVQLNCYKPNLILHIIFSVEPKYKYYSKTSLYFPRWNTPRAGLIRLSSSIIFHYVPCINGGVSNSFNRYCGRWRETLKASQQSESSGSPITAGCIGDRDLLSLCRRYNVSWEGKMGLETSLVQVCRAEWEKHESCAL